MAHRICRPARASILVLTGPVHSGKTTLLKKAAPVWSALGLDLGGFLSEVRSRPGGVEGYDLLDLRTGISVAFLRRASGTPVPGGERDGAEEGPSVGPFRMLPAGLETAAGIMSRDVRRDILVVDEFGPLELAGRGLRASIEGVLSEGARCLCVVRQAILADFAKAMAGRDLVIFRVDDPGMPDILIRAAVPRKEGQRT